MKANMCIFWRRFPVDGGVAHDMQSSSCLSDFQGLLASLLTQFVDNICLQSSVDFPIQRSSRQRMEDAIVLHSKISHYRVCQARQEPS